MSGQGHPAPPHVTNPAVARQGSIATTEKPAMTRRRVVLLLLLLPLIALADYSIGLLRGLDGSIHTLDEYTDQGRWTVVMLWASDCPACNAEAASYQAFHQTHARRGDAQMVGVSLDGLAHKADAEAFIARHGLSFTNLIDEPETVAKMYQDLTGKPWIGTPTFLVFSPSGELRAAQVGAVPVKLIEAFIARESAEGS